MGFEASLMTANCAYKLAASVPLKSAMTHSTWLDTCKLMSYLTKRRMACAKQTLDFKIRLSAGIIKIIKGKSRLRSIFDICNKQFS